MEFTLLLQAVVVLAAVEAVKAAKAAKAIKAEKAARRRPTTGKEDGATNGKVAVRMGSAVDGISDTRALQTLMLTALRATLPPLISLHALIQYLLILLIILLLLLNPLAITVEYLPVVRMILHCMTLNCVTTILSVSTNGLGDLSAVTINIVSVTAITVRAN